MKKLILISILSISFSCSKKQEFKDYKVVSVSRPGTYACKYSLSAGTGDNLEIWAECGRYQPGEIVLRVLK